MDIDQGFVLLKQRFDSLEQRLASIEKRLGLAQKPSDSLTIPPSKPSQPSSSATASGETVKVAPAFTPAVHVPKAPEPVASGNWLGAIAVVCFVLAAGFIVKLTVDSGWLTPERQLGLAALFGFSLIGAGFWLSRSDREYASLLPAAGIIVLYLTAFAAHRIQSILSFQGALIAISAISAFSVWLYTEIKHDIYAVTAAVGSYVAPVVLNLNTGDIFSAYYFLLCSFAFATISVWVNSRILAIVSAYLAIGITAALGSSLNMDQTIATLLALHFLIFTLATFLHTRIRGTELSETAAFSYLPVLLLFYACEYYFVSKITPAMAPWFSLAFAAIPFGLYLIAQRLSPSKVLASRSMIFTFTTMVVFHAGYIELLPKDAHPWLFSAILIIAALAPNSFFERVKTGSDASKVPRLALIAIVAIEYCHMLFKLFDKPPVNPFDASVVSAIVALASLWLVIVMITTQGKKHLGDLGIYLVSAHALAILAFYNLAYEQGSLAVSIAWLIYAACVMGFAFQIQNEKMAKSAVAVLGLAAAKALLYDAASAVAPVRIVCLILTGAVLYGAGLLMRRISNWRQN